VHDGALGTAERFERAVDQVLAALREHLDGDVVGDQVLLDELADEVEVGLAGRREADLDLLVAHLYEQVEHPALALRGHRIDEGLVAVAEVDGAPSGRFFDDLVGPLAVGQRYRELLEVRLIPLIRHRAGALTCDGIVRGHAGAPERGLGRRRASTPRRGACLGWGLVAAAKKK
jgi:hypothetical protein